jgi:ribosomal protein S15P/S13E
LSTYDTTTPGTAGQTGSDPGGATAKAQEAAGQAQEKAQQAAGQARDRVRDEVDTRSTQAGEQAETVANDVRSVGEHLRSEGKDKPAEYADKAAARVAALGDYLKRSDGDAILRDVERFGRERPWAVMAGGVVLGIAASRFLKASSSRRYHEQESSANLPARRTDVDRDVLPAPTPAPAATTPVPGAPERELSLTGGVMPPQQQSGPGFRSGA